MKQIVLDDKLIIGVIESAVNCNDKEKINRYISDVTDRCNQLCKKGEPLRALNEYKFMIENLKKVFCL